MLDRACVFSATGCILWERTLAKSKTDAVDALVRTVLLEQRGGGSGAQTATLGDSAAAYLRLNQVDLVVCLVYQRVLQLTYVAPLLLPAARGAAAAAAATTSAC